MIGQIRSYISFMDENSPDDYIIRIKNMIDSLPDDKNKYMVNASYLNKLNQINQIKKYLKIKQENNNKKVTTKEVEILDIKDEPQMYYSSSKVINKSVVNNTNIDIMSALKLRIKPYNLIRISKLEIILVRESFRNIPKSISGETIVNGIPSLPIIEEIKKKDIKEDIDNLKLGIYLDSKNIKWIFGRDGKLSLYDLNDHIINEFKYTVDNLVLSLENKKGNIQLLKLIKKSNKSYDVFLNKILVNNITFLGDLI